MDIRIESSSSKSNENVSDANRAQPNRRKDDQTKTNKEIRHHSTDMSSSKRSLKPSRMLPVMLFISCCFCFFIQVDANERLAKKEQLAGRLFVISSSSQQREQPIQLFPGLLDESLLARGSFSFGAKLVNFDKLRVLGNVYVNKINGKPLRQSYLLRSTIQQQKRTMADNSAASSENNQKLRETIIGSDRIATSIDRSITKGKHHQPDD